MTRLSLRAGRLAVELAPRAGGSIARFRHGDTDLLRPMAGEAIASGRGNEAACYPLVPFSNRIANGRLVFDGQEFKLDANWQGVRHPMHGEGWASAWEVASSDGQSAKLVHQHDGSTGWPFRYRAQLTFRLDEGALAVNIAIENLENRATPAGIGLHPFFRRKDDSELAFRAGAVWLADREVLPTKRIAVPADWDYSRSRKIQSGLDNCFEDWDGRALIAWPSCGLRLELQASPPFRQAVVYTPASRPFFCFEPVSHVNGKVSEARLAAGARLAGEVAFHVSTL